jgi:hypothetical protein
LRGSCMICSKRIWEELIGAKNFLKFLSSVEEIEVYLVDSEHYVRLKMRRLTGFESKRLCLLFWQPLDAVKN